MILPERFENKLKQDSKLLAGVKGTFAEFEDWLSLNRLTFFEEFTDHGPNHIDQVLATADWVIPNHSWNEITPQDVATLVLSILVHDSGMHLQPDGFLSLLDEPRIMADYDDKPWREEYEAFLSQALRYDDNMLRAIFGSTEPVTRPHENPEHWTKRDRRLIGEFLRRHHHRLAHEIAVQGVPGPTQERMCFQGVPHHIAQFAGLVGRSHGMSLRATIEAIEQEDRRQDRGVHLPYLMAVLRVSDYLQIQDARAPENLRKISSLRSPISRDEWDKHEAIKDIRYDVDADPEAVFIKAKPKTAKLFVKLKELLLDIQHELDTSWAVLGELYGRYNHFGLRLRRVKSNLDDIQKFSKTVDYIPERVVLESAGADLLSLLTGPLYGNKPEIGVRELLQNSVDACRELMHYVQKFNPPTFTQTTQVNDITILFKTNPNGIGGTVTVIDKGIGMTVDTIKNYFLKAGASFRKNPFWRETYLDESGHATVTRSGRFGIGVLAAFMLGDELSVTTRHITASEEEGISFSCSLTSDFIELRRLRAPVGTTITVRVGEKVWQKLYTNPEQVDWYCLEEPTLGINWDGKNYKQKHNMPASDSRLPLTWHRLSHPNFEDIHWAYDINRPSTVCNGIRVGDQAGQPQSELFEEFFELEDNNPFRYSLALPKLSIFDPDTNLPHNLQRDKVYYDELPFREQLCLESVKDLIAYMLACTPTCPPQTYQNLLRYESFTPSGIRWAMGGTILNWFWFTREGLALFDPRIVRRHRLQRFVLATRNVAVNLRPILQDPTLLFDDLRSKETAKNWIRAALGLKTTIERQIMRSNGARIVMSPSLKDLLWNGGVIPKSIRDSYSWRLSKGKGVTGDWWILSTSSLKDVPESKLVKDVTSLPEGSGYAAIAEWHVDQHRAAALENSMFSQAWQTYIGTRVIPFDLEVRKDQLADAYVGLEAYLEKYS